MPETTVEQKPVETKVEPPVTNQQPPVQEPPKQEDLVTRASKVKLEPTNNPQSIEEPKFDLNDIEKITDPVAKEQALKAYKSFQRGFNDKFQQLAEIRKTYEAKLANDKWTKERIKQIQNDPEFIRAAQEVMQEQNPPESGVTDTEWSAMTSKEKQQLLSMQAEIQSLKAQQQQQAILSEFRKQDEQLKNRYANYDSQKVDILTADLLSNKVKATREHLFKALDYDEAVRRAYELGKQDGQVERSEKIGASSFEGVTTTQPAKDTPQPENNESTMSYFRKLAYNAIQKQKAQR